MGGKTRAKLLRQISERGGFGGLALAMGLTLGRRLLARPGVAASLDGLRERLFLRRPKPVAEHPAVGAAADAVVRLLRQTGPMPCRMGVDGVPGSGKTSLAAALADRLAMDAVCLDHQDIDAPKDLRRPFTVFEHHRLLRTQDIEPLDAVVYVDEPLERSRAKLLARKKGAYLLEVLDFERLKRIGELAYAMADGDDLAVAGCGLRLKRRPSTGYRQRERLEAALAQRGRTGESDVFEAGLFRLAGLPPRSGLTAYLTPRLLAGEAAAVVREFFEAPAGRRRR